MARAALVIGNSNYEQMSILRTPSVDADAISRFAQTMGFKTQTLLDAHGRQLDVATRRFLLDLEEGDTALFWFSGHGMNLQNKDLLLPIDADPAVPDAAHAGFDLDDFINRMTARRLDAVIVVVDACREMPTLRSPSASRAMRGLSFQHPAPNGMIVVYSAGLGESALDDLGQSDVSANSVFTRKTLDYLYKTELSVYEAFCKAREDVIALAKSINHRQTPAIYHQLSAPLYLFEDPTRSIPLPSSGSVSPSAHSPGRSLEAPSSAVRKEPTSTVNPFILQHGFRTEASVSAIAFLWSNWEVFFRLWANWEGLYRLRAKLFSAERISEDAWRASGNGGIGTWYLTKSVVGLNSGRFEFVSTGKFLGMHAEGRSTFWYDRIGASNIIAYGGVMAGDPPGPLRRMRWLVDLIANRAGAAVNRIGGEAASAITRNPGLLEGHATRQQQRLFADMLAEEVQMLKNRPIQTRFFGADGNRSERELEVDPATLLQLQLDRAAEKIASVEAQRVVVGLKVALKLFHDSPRRAIDELHALLEGIVRDTLTMQTGSPPRPASLKTQLRRLGQTKTTPRRIALLMSMVAEDNAGDDTDDFYSFRTSFDAMLAIVDWYDQFRL